MSELSKNGKESKIVQGGSGGTSNGGSDKGPTTGGSRSETVKAEVKPARTLKPAGKPHTHNAVLRLREFLKLCILADFRVNWCCACVIMTTLIIGISITAIGIEHAVAEADRFPIDESRNYEYGMSVLKKYLAGDISTALFLDSIDSEAKLAESALKALFSDPTVPGFYLNADPMCLPKNMHYYRTYDGSCNWIRNGEATLGMAGQPYGRDTPGVFYADGFNAPRTGPNPREMSNIFWNRSNADLTYWEHTQYLIGFVEFLIHDLVGSNSGHDPGDFYNIPVPQCDSFFDPNCTGTAKMPFWRNKKVPGTGVNGTPREVVNDDTIWIDLETIYGNNQATNAKLRSFVDGKLLINDDGFLPFNDDKFNLNMVWRWNKTDVFIGGDPRTNQDFLIQAWQHLWVKEHNRMCDVLIWKYPDWDDETLFLTARTVTACKFSMVGNAYFIAYFKETMPFPVSPLNIYSDYTGVPHVSPVQTFPWAGANNPVTHRPDPLPNEFSVGYRWHDLLPDHIVHPVTNQSIDLIATAWSAQKFKDIGLQNIYQAMADTSIPNFRSGLSDGYRNIRFSFRDPEEGMNFDLVAWAIEHERERGLPPFNEWARNYQGKIPIKPRATFEEFTSNPYFVRELKRLYATPDDVDLYLGQELDETKWPNTFIPTSMLAISFYTLFKGGATDRFALNFGVVHCIIEQKPWNCRPNNILQELLWKPVFNTDNYRIPDVFWLEEFDLVNQGTTMLRKVISQNTPVKCLQTNPFFLYDPVRNPMACWGVNDMPGPDYNEPTKYLEAINFLVNYGKFGTFQDLTTKYGPVVRVGVADPQSASDKILVILNRIDDFDSLFGSGEDPTWLNRDFPDYFKRTYGQVAGVTTGYGISNAVGWEWKRRKWIHNTYIVPLFPSLMPSLNDHAQQLVDAFYNHAPNIFSPFEAININYKDIMAEFSYSRAYLDANPANRLKLFDAYQSWLDGSHVAIETGVDARTAQMNFVHQFTKTLVDQKKASGNNGTDWVGLYLSTPDMNGTLLDEEAAYTIPFDYTVGNLGSGVWGMTFALWTLAKQASVQDAVYNEVISVAGNDGAITYQQLHQMPYLQATTMEVFRWFPPGGHIGGGRKSTQQSVLEGYQIPGGVTALLQSYLIQHNKRYWPDPEHFYPDRFIQTPRPNPDYAFQTFGAGKMACGGSNLAKLQMSVNLAYILRRFKLIPTDDAVLTPDYVREYYGMGMFETFNNPPTIRAMPRQAPSSSS